MPTMRKRNEKPGDEAGLIIVFKKGADAYAYVPKLPKVS